jgi:hypothetical protein
MRLYGEIHAMGRVSLPVRCELSTARLLAMTGWKVPSSACGAAGAQ